MAPREVFRGSVIINRISVRLSSASRRPRRNSCVKANGFNTARPLSGSRRPGACVSGTVAASKAFRVARQALKPARSSSCCKFLPMKTSLDSRGSPSAHSPPSALLKIMCTPW